MVLMDPPKRLRRLWSNRLINCIDSREGCTLSFRKEVRE